jgi:hypothetical protein
MTPTDKTVQLDNALLLTMHTNNTPLGLPASALRLLVRDFGGGTPYEDDVTARLEYLAMKGLAAEISGKVHIRNRAWKITELGRQYIDEQNL